MSVNMESTQNALQNMQPTEEAEGVKSLEIGKLGGNEDLVEMGEVE